tara:strand:- start:215 stop:535 length:321 start_codon:yes stop_codon:yes gene_type:complete
MFYHRLALALGMTVSEMLQKMSSAELTDWLAYWRLDPFGEERADLRAGIVAATTANVWAGKGKRAKPADFMPKFDTPSKRQTADQMRAQFRLAAAAFNRVSKKKHG